MCFAFGFCQTARPIEIKIPDLQVGNEVEKVEKQKTSTKQHFELTKKNLIIVISIFAVCIGIPMLILLNI